MYSQVLKPTPDLKREYLIPIKMGEQQTCPVPTVRIINNFLLCACRTPCPYNRDVTGSCYIASVRICSQLQSHNKSSGVIFVQKWKHAEDTSYLEPYSRALAFLYLSAQSAVTLFVWLSLVVSGLPSKFSTTALSSGPTHSAGLVVSKKLRLKQHRKFPLKNKLPALSVRRSRWLSWTA